MKVKYKQTGQVYEMPDNAQVDTNLFEPVDQGQINPQSTTRTGHTLPQIISALNSARAVGDTTAESDINDDYQKELQYQKDLSAGAYDTPEQKAVKAEQTKALTSKVAEQEKNKKVAKAAQDFLDTFISLKGDTTSDEAKKKLAFAAGKYNATAGFGEGGKQLTGTELGILAPTLLSTERQRTQNWFQQKTGEQPDLTKGYLKDDVTTAVTKMKEALKYTNPETLKKYQNIEAGKSNGGNILQNAGSDVKDILNGILNIPKAAVDYSIQKGQQGQAPNPTSILADTVLGVGKGMVNEYNQLAGEPLKGGDVLQKILDRAYKKPVSTALDLLPLLGLLKGGKGVIPTTETTVADSGNVAKTLATSETINPIQKLFRKISDIAKGGGSKEYISRVAKTGIIPENQVLLDEGILTHPTGTGQITATAKSMQKYGKQLADVYDNAKTPIMGDELSVKLDTELSGMGYDQKAIRFIKSYVNKYGKFDLATLDTKIPQNKAWLAAQKLEDSPPKMMKNPESAAQYNQLSQDTAKIIRKELGTRNPDTLPLNEKYSALADYYYNILKNPEGLGVKGGLFNTMGKVSKAGTDSLINILYKGVGLPTKILRDMRYK